jgi:hypothetical protein
VVSLNFRLFLPWGKKHSYLLDGWLGGLQKLLGRLGGKIKFIPFPEIEKQFLGYPA